MDEREVEEGSEVRSTRSHEEVRGDVQIGGNGQSRSAKEVHENGTDRGSLGDGYESLVDMRVVETVEFKG